MSNNQTPALHDLNFKVEADFHRTYKLVATLKGMTMKELLEGSFYEWVRRHGDQQLKRLIRD